MKGVIVVGLQLMACTVRADYILPGDPEELCTLRIVGIVWIFILTTACFGLYRIRKAHALLPHS